MLIAKNLSYENSDGVLFHDVNISLNSSAQKRVAIVGKNGCGKTTFIKILKGEIEPTSGNISSSQEIIAHLPQDISFPDETQTVEAYPSAHLSRFGIEIFIGFVLSVYPYEGARMYANAL